MVVKRSGDKEPFVRAKLVAGMQSAAKNRPVTVEQMEQLASEVEEAIRSRGGHATSEEIGVAVLERLRELDEVAYLRFASVYKGFSDVGGPLSQRNTERAFEVAAGRAEPKGVNWALTRRLRPL